MVEGGAQIIGSFFAEIEESIIDSIIITVAPTFVGSEGVGYGVQLHSEIVRVFSRVMSIDFTMRCHHIGPKIRACEIRPGGGRYCCFININN